MCGSQFLLTYLKEGAPTYRSLPKGLQWSAKEGLRLKLGERNSARSPTRVTGVPVLEPSQTAFQGLHWQNLGVRSSARYYMPVVNILASVFTARSIGQMPTPKTVSLSPTFDFIFHKLLDKNVDIPLSMLWAQTSPHRAAATSLKSRVMASVIAVTSASQETRSYARPPGWQHHPNTLALQFPPWSRRKLSSNIPQAEVAHTRLPSF